VCGLALSRLGAAVVVVGTHVRPPYYGWVCAREARGAQRLRENRVFGVESGEDFLFWVAEGVARAGVFPDSGTEVRKP